jgi:hypothetical protein
MNTSIADIPKKRGRPSTGGRRDGILVRVPQPMLDDLDAWRLSQPKPLSRPEAIRAMVAAVLLMTPKANS